MKMIINITLINVKFNKIKQKIWNKILNVGN